MRSRSAVADLWNFLLLLILSLCCCGMKNFDLWKYPIATLHLSVDEGNSRDSIYTAMVIGRLDSIYYCILDRSIGPVAKAETVQDLRKEVERSRKDEKSSLSSLMAELRKKGCRYLLVPTITAEDVLFVTAYFQSDSSSRRYGNFNCSEPIGRIGFEKGIESLMSEAADSLVLCLKKQIVK